MEQLKARLCEVTDAATEVVTESVSAASEKVEEKLDQAKDEWAELTMKNPDEARRKLRTFWIVVAGGFGIVLGILLATVYHWIF